MHKHILAILVTVVIMILINTFVLDRDESEEAQEMINLAQNFIQLLTEERYDEATQLFDEPLKDQLNPARLEEEWKYMENEWGELLEYPFDRIESIDKYETVILKGRFEKNEFEFRITFDADHFITDFFIP